MMSTERRPILLASARIIDPSTNLDIDGDLLIVDGVIREAKRGIGAAGVPEGTDVIDCRGKLIAPGLIDMRAFVGEPGAEYRETIASASQAAAAGGVTTIVCQPDTSPVIDDPAIVDFVLRRARDTSIVHVHPMAALTKGLRGEEMAEIGLLKAAGAIAFTDGAKSVTNAQVMRRALTYACDFDALVAHHTEDPDIVGEGVMNEGEFAARLGLAGVPTAAETIMLERDMRLVALTQSRYHAASITCAESLEVLARAKEQGLAVTASASINHLTLNEIDVGPYRTFLKVSPPLRIESDRAALVAALGSGLIDVVMSDHNPQDVEGKRLPFSEASHGAIGLETMLDCRPASRPLGRAADHDLAQGHDERAGTAAAPSGRNAAARKRSGRDRARSGRALGARSRRAQIKMQEHAVRRGAAARPRGPDHRCRSHCVRAPVGGSPAAAAPERPLARCDTISHACGADIRQSAASGLSEGPMLQSINSSLLPAYTAALAFGYFCGSVPFGLILTRLAGTDDIRSIGSGNIGATNVLRTGRKGLALATLLGDALKGTVAVALVYSYYGNDYEYFAHEMAMPAALGAFLGHLFPVWLGFKGGKGVATYIGILLAMAWPAAIGFCLIWGWNCSTDPLLLVGRARSQRRNAFHAVDAGASRGRRHCSQS